MLLEGLQNLIIELPEDLVRLVVMTFQASRNTTQDAFAALGMETVFVGAVNSAEVTFQTGQTIISNAWAAIIETTKMIDSRITIQRRIRRRIRTIFRRTIRTTTIKSAWSLLEPPAPLPFA